MRARIFLSYSRTDGKVACDFFQKALQNVGYDVWRDIDNVPGGAPWRQLIDDTIRAVDVVLLFLTPDANASENVEEEWRTAIRFRKRIVPLIVAQTAVPTDLLSYNYRDIREPTAYQLEPSNVQRDLEEERRKLQYEVSQLQGKIGTDIVDSSQRKYLEPFAEHLRMALDAERAGSPPEVLRMLFLLLSKLVDELAAGHDIAPLVESMTAGTYAVEGRDEESVYKLRIEEVLHVLKKVRDAIPSSSVPVIVVAMTRAEAADLAAGNALAGLPPEWQKEFEALSPDLPPDWQQRYGATSEGWEPFAGEGSIEALIRSELQLLGQSCKWSLRSSFVQIRDLSLEKNRQLLLKLRAGGCVVVMDAISAWHPQLQAAFRATSLDVLPNSLVVRVSPHQTLDSVRNKVGFLLREWLNCEFFQRAYVDLDERCETVMQLRDLRRWMRNRLKDAVPEGTIQKSQLRQHINNFGG